MIQALDSMIRYRDLLFMITWRDFRAKYKQSVMGFLWAIFMPLIIISAGIVIKLAFSYVSKKPLEMQDFMTISVKSLPWSFFVASIRFSSNSLISNTNLVTKIYFPRIIFPVSAVISQLFDFIIASTVLVVLLVVFQSGASVHLLWVPVLLLILIVLAMGLGILFWAANLFFRDVKYLVEVILTFAIFFTRLRQAETFVLWERLLMVNPVAPIMEGLRSCVVLHQAPDPLWTAYSAVFALFALIIAVASFGRMEPLFAESI